MLLLSLSTINENPFTIHCTGYRRLALCVISINLPRLLIVRLLHFCLTAVFPSAWFTALLSADSCSILACIQQLLLTERLCSCCKSIYIKRRKKERGTRPWTACHYHLVSWSLDGLQQVLQSIQSWIAPLFCRLHCCNWWRPKLLKSKINKWHNR